MKDICINPSAICESNGTIWFVQEQINCLMNYNLEKKIFECKKELPYKNKNSILRYEKILEFENRIFLIPIFGYCICVYNKETGELNELEINDSDKYEGKELFVNAFVIDRNIYCVPCKYDFLIAINVSTLNVMYLYNMMDAIRQLTGSNIEYLGPTYYYEERFIAGLIPEKNLFYQYDIEKKQVVIKHMDIEKPGLLYAYSSFAYIDRKIFLYDKVNKDIVKYSIVNNQIIGSIRLNSQMTYRIGTFGKYILVDSLYNSNVLILDEEFELVFECRNNGLIEKGFGANDSCLGIIVNRGKYYYNAYDNSLYEFSMGKMERVVCFETKIGEKIYYRGFQSFQHENKEMDLNMFIEFTKYRNPFYDRKESNKESQGKNIFLSVTDFNSRELDIKKSNCGEI